MILIHALGLGAADEDSLRGNFDKMVDGAEDMIVSNVTVTPSDWASMLPIERKALAVAGKKLRAENAFMIACGVANPQYQEALANEAFGEGGAMDYRKGKALGLMQDVMEKLAEAGAGA